MAKFLRATNLQRFLFTGIGILLGVLSLLTPFWEVAEPASYVGGLLVWAAVLEILHGFKRAENQARFSAWISGAITLVIGVLMINALLFQHDALINFILFLFLFDAARYVYLFFKSKRKGIPGWRDLLPGIGNILVVAIIVLFKGKGLEWVVSLCGALRIFGMIYQLFTARLGTSQNIAEDIIENLGLKGNTELETLAKKLDKENQQSISVDKGWIITFLLVLFFVHLGRMGFDQSKIKILSPLVAVIGDMVIALIVAFGVIAPFRTLV